MEETITIYKLGDQWVGDFMNKARQFIFNIDMHNVWSSLNILPHGAVQFECDQSGNLLKVTDVRFGVELDKLVIPKRHAVGRMLFFTKPIRE